jgi:ribosomal protein S12 methylthiotransferase
LISPAVPRAVCVVSLGCPKNLVDSEHILGVLGRSGWRIAATPELADVVVVNTCGFLQSAVKEAYGVIRGILDSRLPNQCIVVAGCLVQRQLAALQQMFPQVEHFIGIDDIPRLPAILGRPGKTAGRPLRAPTGLCRAGLPRLVSTPGHYAFLRIADGCDNCCAYCLIPSIRGRLRSRSLHDILREARMLAANQVRELILIAQDTTAYGLDIVGRSLLAPLLRRLARVEGIEWLRVLYTHPAHFTPDLLDELAASDKVVKYIDLPLQHISDRLLQCMNRRSLRSDVEFLLGRLRSIPGMAIRTTFITGLPGETRAEFAELLEFVHQGHFAHVGCFAYSPEPGTRAARMPGPVAPATREARARELMAAQRRISLARNRALVGRTAEVRIDRFDSGRNEYLGRTYADAPEIDNTAHVRGDRLIVGSVVSASVIRAGAYDIWAESSEQGSGTRDQGVGSGRREN